MSDKDYYEIFAKKLDEGVICGLSPDYKTGEIIETWMEYLKELIKNPEDIKYLVKLDQVPNWISAKRFAKKIDKPLDEALEILQRLIDNDLVMKIGRAKPKYAIQITQLIHNGPPLRYFDMPKDKAKKLAELSYKYLVEDKWYKPYAGGPKTPGLRVIPIQESLEETKTSILPYDDVEKILDEARVIGLAKCACKMRNEILDIRKCKGKYPLETCMFLNQGAVSMIEKGLAREITKDEAKKLCKEFNSMGLIHTTENFSEGPHQGLCNCCSCCCNPLSGITQWDNPRGVASAEAPRGRSQF